MSGRSLGGYELLSPLGRGSQGSVLRAVRSADGLEVALKVLAPERLSEPRFEARFRQEAEVLAQVPHENLVRFIELVETETPRRLAYAMELLEGRSLREHLDAGSLSTVQEAVEIGLGVARGLDALHRAGVVHRDLKPENVLLRADGVEGPARVKILDFGVALGPGPLGGTLEPAAGLVGTPRYMAPEQAAGLLVDARADLYALGVILFEMLSGQRPHDGDTLRAIIAAKLKTAPKVVVGHEQEVLPIALTEVVDACLRQRPSERPESAEHVLRVLEESSLVLGAVGRIHLDAWTRTVPQGKPMVRRLSATEASPTPEPSSPVREALETPSEATLLTPSSITAVVFLLALLVLGLWWVFR